MKKIVSIIGLVAALGIGFVTSAEPSFASSSASSASPISVTAGPDRTCAVYSDGALYCWGTNSNGNLGIGGIGPSVTLTPTRVKDLPPVSSVAIGSDSTCAITTENLEVYCWGDNSSGSLATTTVTQSSRPMKIQGITLARKIAISASAGTCAVLSPYADLNYTPGTIYCWGAGTFVPTYAGVTRDIAAGNNFFCKTANNGYYCFDSFLHADLVKVNSGFFRSWSEKAWIAAGGDQSCGRSYTYWNGFGCMGAYNYASELGGDQNILSVPTSLSLGTNYSCLTSGAAAGAFCWGNNDRGQLGLGYADYSSHSRLEPVPLPGLSSIAASPFGKNTCAIASASVYCWGANDKGQLGDGSVTDRYSPTLTASRLELFDSTPTPIFTSAPRLGAELTPMTGNWDSGAVLAYQWLRDGSPIQGANSASYTPSASDYQHAIAMQVTGSLSGYASHTETSAEAQVGPGLFANPPIAAIDGAPYFGATLVARASSLEQDASVAYQWLRDGKAISGFDSSTYVLKYGDLNHQISFKLVESKPGYDSVSVVSGNTTLIKNRFARQVRPVVKGISSVGSVLTTVVTPFGAGASYTYQWLRDGVAIAGASDRKYVLTPADLGSSVSFRVCGSKLLFESACLDSTASVVGLGDLGRKPVVTLKFASVKVGAVVTGKPGVWQSGVSLSYSWLRDGVEIAGENQTTHQITAADLGHNLTFKVLAQKNGYADVTRTTTPQLVR